MIFFITIQIILEVYGASHLMKGMNKTRDQLHINDEIFEIHSILEDRRCGKNVMQ
jgi:hypothetical protein